MNYNDELAEHLDPLAAPMPHPEIPAPTMPIDYKINWSVIAATTAIVGFWVAVAVMVLA